MVPKDWWIQIFEEKNFRPKMAKKMWQICVFEHFLATWQIFHLFLIYETSMIYYFEYVMSSFTGEKIELRKKIESREERHIISHDRLSTCCIKNVAGMWKMCFSMLFARYFYFCSWYWSQFGGSKLHQLNRMTSKQTIEIYN